ncbi:hypothetical protein DSECCO2_198700 [anaerobic digester metagenome]
MAALMKISVPGLSKIAQYRRLNLVKILIGNLAAVSFDDIVKTALFVQAQHQGAVFFVITKGIFHLVAVTKNFRAGDNPFISKARNPGLHKQV